MSRLRRCLAVGVALTVVLAAEGSGVDPTLPSWTGSAPDHFSVVWQADVRNRHDGEFDVTPPVVTGRVIAVPDGTALQLWDPATGRLRRRIDTSIDPVTKVVAVGDVVVAQVGDLGGESLHVYDAMTGRLRWRAVPSGGLTIQGPGEGSGLPGDWPFVVTAEAVVVQGADGFLRGFDLDDGHLIWQRRAGDGECSSPAATPAVLVVLAVCPGRPARLTGYGPGTGEVLWQAELGPVRGLAEWSVTPVGTLNAFEAQKGAALRLFTETGDRIGEYQGLDGRNVVGVVAGELVLISGDDGSVVARGADDGRVRWTRRIPPVAGAVPGHRAVYFTHGAPVGPNASLPELTTIIDPAGRVLRSLPWPVNGHVAGIAGDLLIVTARVGGAIRYLAMRAEAGGSTEREAGTRGGRVAELGGVAPSDWPDACALLSPARLAAAGRGYVAAPAPESRRVAGVRLPHPSRCGYLTKSGAEQDVFEVAVMWVGRDPAAARAYAASVPPIPSRTSVIAPGVTLYTELVYDEAVTRALVVTGRRVLRVTAPVNPALTRKTALLIATGRPASPTVEPDGFTPDAAEAAAERLGYRLRLEHVPPGPLRVLLASCPGGDGEASEAMVFHGAKLAGVLRPRGVTGPPFAIPVSAGRTQVTWGSGLRFSVDLAVQAGEPRWRGEDDRVWEGLAEPTECPRE